MATNTNLVMVHKTDCEGALLIDRDNGIVKQPLDERPEWAEGLSCALIAERALFYTSRLGPDAAKPIITSTDTPLNFADLGWIALDGEGEPCELEADSEFRMQFLADHLGIDREADIASDVLGQKVDTEAAVLLDMNNEATAEDVTALGAAQEASFDSDHEEKTGT